MLKRLFCRIVGHSTKAQQVIPDRPWRGEADRIVVMCERCGATGVIRAVE